MDTSLLAVVLVFDSSLDLGRQLSRDLVDAMRHGRMQRDDLEDLLVGCRRHGEPTLWNDALEMPGHSHAPSAGAGRLHSLRCQGRSGVTGLIGLQFDN